MYEDVIESILSVIPEKIEKIILYGSEARGTATPESDIDIALITNSKIDYMTSKQLNNVLADFDLKYDKIFSVIDIDEANFLYWKDISSLK